MLYDSNGTTALATKSISGGAMLTATANRAHIWFDTPQAILKDTYYRLVVKPTTANSVTVYDNTLHSAAALDSLPGGQNAHLTTRVDAGSWTDTTTRKPIMGVLCDQFDDQTGGAAPGFSSPLIRPA